MGIGRRGHGDSKAVSGRCSAKTVFLKASQNSQQNNCTRVSFLTKLQAPLAI